MQDGSGGVSFDEFVEYYNLLAGDGNGYDAALEMFRHFDADGNDAIDRDEFLTLINQAIRILVEIPSRKSPRSHA